MTFNDILKESWLSISGNKVRSFLTVLGIIIGVMAVVIMVAVGETVSKQVSDQFSSLGTNTITIRAGAAQSAGVRTGNRQTLTIDDAEFIGQLPDVAAYSPIQNASAQVIYGNQNWATSMVGAYPGYEQVQNLEMEYGTFFNQAAVRNGSTYAIIGPQTAEELQMPENPVGEIIRVQNMPFTIIGMTRERGDSGMFSQDDMIIIPITTLKKRLQGSRFPNSVSTVTLKLNENADNALVIEQITALLRDRHKLADDEADDFQIMDMKQMMEAMDTVTGYMTMLLIAIAAVSLLVGSIGIMNMMLVSVSERTAEIGLRKALGAKPSVILFQFLVEAVFISILGGALGVALGAVISYLASLLIGYEFTFRLTTVLLAVGFSAAVGLIFGILPARKASKLSPIDALRTQ